MYKIEWISSKSVNNNNIKILIHETVNIIIKIKKDELKFNLSSTTVLIIKLSMFMIIHWINIFKVRL